MRRIFNNEQRKSLASFCNTIAAAWFIGIFATPNFIKNVSPLTVVLYFVSMIMALGFSLFLLKEEERSNI